MGKNNTFYFSHDYSARNDPKMQKVLMRHGQQGKGVFWDLVEMLYEQDGYLILSEIDSYSFTLRTDSKLIDSLIKDFDLFGTDGISFWSDSVLKRLSIRKEKSEKAKASVNSRWGEKKENDTNVPNLDTNELRFEFDRNTIKESKVNEKKSLNIEFEVFWKLYPVRVGRKESEKKWKSLTDKERTKIMETLPHFIAYKPFDTYNHPNPSKYFKEARWEDEQRKPNNSTQHSGYTAGAKPIGAVQHGK
ncbi:Lin1244/Lin1753 domain-containing protein [Pedobacter sp. Du54]|uniref:Lin1244/Lin1753 domain-containing protein n=1 Tax=Pedobacter anseongensis TaxID=3133439 RepID=UPI003096A5AD